MNTAENPNYFPMTKGTILIVGMVLVFAAIMLATYLWYDIRIEQINQSLQQLNH